MLTTIDNRTLCLFGNDAVPCNFSLKDLVERGDLKAALNFIEQADIKEAIEIALESGFTVYGSEKDSALFYVKMGEQLVVACEQKRLPQLSYSTENSLF